MEEDEPKRVSSYKWRIPEWFPELPELQQAKLRNFNNELISFNGRINLISARSEPKADQVHFADAILGSRVVAKHLKGDTVHDLGSGNGIPGFVLAILFPDIKVIGVDSDARKMEFLKHCAHRFDIKNFSVIHTRIEDLQAESIQCAVSRGLGTIPKLLLLLRDKMVKDANIFHFKSDRWSQELISLPPQLFRYWDHREVEHYTLPESETELTIIETYAK